IVAGAVHTNVSAAQGDIMVNKMTNDVIQNIEKTHRVERDPQTVEAIRDTVIAAQRVSAGQAPNQQIVDDVTNAIRESQQDLPLGTRNVVSRSLDARKPFSVDKLRGNIATQMEQQGYPKEQFDQAMQNCEGAR
ncbi:MAG: hypothetical protein CUN55_19655, partial [Phototrophicales bacterium]